jgi:alanyl-tRNA synthetase
MREVDTNYLIALGSELVKLNRKLVTALFSLNEITKFVIMTGEEAMEAGADAGKLAQEVAKILGGGGGGKVDLGQGGGPLAENIPNAIEFLEKTLEEISKGCR